MLSFGGKNLFHQLTFYSISIFKSVSSLVALTVKCLSTMREIRVRSLGWEDPLEKEMAVHSRTLAWKILWTEEPGRLQSMGSQRVGHDWATSMSMSMSMSTSYWVLGTKEGIGCLSFIVRVEDMLFWLANPLLVWKPNSFPWLPTHVIIAGTITTSKVTSLTGLEGIWLNQFCGPLQKILW